MSSSAWWIFGCASNSGDSNHNHASTRPLPCCCARAQPCPYWIVSDVGNDLYNSPICKTALRQQRGPTASVYSASDEPRYGARALMIIRAPGPHMLSDLGLGLVTYHGPPAPVRPVLSSAAIWESVVSRRKRCLLRYSRASLLHRAAVDDLRGLIVCPARPYRPQSPRAARPRVRGP
jgi:hypothetical protein